MFFWLLWEAEKGLTVNQLCFSSVMNMNYDNLDILVVKPKKQENQSFLSFSKSLWHQNWETETWK